MGGSLDLNADVGEGFPHDAALLELISSANVACGFHAGDAETMRWLCEACAERGVVVGAQVSYRDREGFGRRDVEIEYDDLLADVVEQLEQLRAQAAWAGVTVRYVKPHGALYNRAWWDPEQARAVVDAAGGLPVLGLPGSALLQQAADAGVRGVREFFADRGYLADGSLVPRSDPGALVSDPAAVGDRIRQLVDLGTVTAVDGGAVPIRPESICVHGDAADAVGFVKAVAGALAASQITIVPFT